MPMPVLSDADAGRRLDGQRPAHAHSLGQDQAEQFAREISSSSVA